MSHIHGRVTSVMIAANPNLIESQSLERAQVSFAGFEGDRHAGLTMLSGGRTPHYPRGTEIRNSRQVSIVSLEELVETAAALNIPRLMPEWLGANLCLSDIPGVSLLPPGTRLFFSGGVTLVVEGENKPCVQAGAVIESHYPDLKDLAKLFPKAAHRLRGVVAWVEKPGCICAGENLEVRLPPRVLYPMPDSSPAD